MPHSRVVFVGCCIAAMFVQPKAGVAQSTPPAASTCPAEVAGPPALPDERPEHSLVSYWLERMPQPDQLLLDGKQIAAINAFARTLNVEDVHVGRFDLTAQTIDPEPARAVQLRAIDKLQELATQNKRVLLDGSSPATLLAAIADDIRSASPADELRVVLTGTPLRCHPSTQGIYEMAGDANFDYLQCSQAHIGEPVRILLKGKSFWYGWTRDTEGWIDPAALSEPLTTREQASFLSPQRFVIFLADRVPVYAEPRGESVIAQGRMGMMLPRAPGLAVRNRRMPILLPATTGTIPGWVNNDAPIALRFQKFTRRNFWQTAFLSLDSAYGWGGSGNRRDCSQLLRDLFQTFGIELPRNSLAQAMTSHDLVDISTFTDEEKLTAMDAAAQRGIVFVYLPGHILVYLGRDRDVPYGFHLFSGYRVPCAGGGQTKKSVNRTVVSSLFLGRGSVLGSFVKRATRLVVWGPLSSHDSSQISSEGPSAQ